MLPQAEQLDPVEAFAQQLGIRPDEDAEFGWLAEVGLQSPLPPRWTSHEDASTGFMFYVDHDRQVSSWENPLVPYLRRIVEIGRAYLQQRSEDFFEEQKGILWHQHKHELDCWHGPFADPEGRSYFVNETAGVSSWQDPRVDTQYIFELESGLLTTLAEVLPPPDPGWADNGESTPWKTNTGAEVLTLDDSLNDDTPTRASSGDLPERKLTRRLTQTMLDWSRNQNRDEHKTALEKMTQTATWLRSAQQDEKEAQRLQIMRKVEERKKRSQRRAARAARKFPGSRAAFSTQPLGPMPDTPGTLAGRRAPAMLDTGGDETPEGPTPAASPTAEMLGTPSAGPTPLGTPSPSPSHAAAAPPLPQGFTNPSPIPSPTHASPQPPSEPVEPQPPPPPPEPGAAAPILQGHDSGATTLFEEVLAKEEAQAKTPSPSKGASGQQLKGAGAQPSSNGREPSRLFAKLAAAAPAEPPGAA
jgi:hypothetical protein